MTNVILEKVIFNSISLSPTVWNDLNNISGDFCSQTVFVILRNKHIMFNIFFNLQYYELLYQVKV